MENKKNQSEQIRTSDLNYLFKPRSFAHVGVSPKMAAGRFNFTEYLINMKFPGNIYPVNPKYQEILNLKCYPDLASIPGEIDLAVLAIPAPQCPKVLANVPPGKIKFVVIHTSGFGEINKSDLENDILKSARKKGMRIIGPNCMGVYSQQGRVGFWENHHKIVDKEGTLGIVSQSGGHAINIIHNGIDTGMRFNKVLSLGNQIDLKIYEVLEYMGNDDSIGVIGMYVEDIKDGRRFHNLLKEITKRKPVVVWKGGLSQAGKAAAATHTGSMAGNEVIFASAMKQSGVVMADDINEFAQLLRLLQPEYPLPTENLAIISPGGGNTVSICDVFSSKPNIRLPRLNKEIQDKLKKLLPEENVDIKNPVDPGAVGHLSLDKIFDIVLDDSQIECLLMLMSGDFLSAIEDNGNRMQAGSLITAMMKMIIDKKGKPVFMMMQQMHPNNEESDFFKRIIINNFIQSNIAWIDGSFRDGAAVFSKLVWYNNYRKRYK